MSDLGNKEVMAKNLRYYIERSGKTQKDVAAAIDVPPSTFNAWLKAKKYPRIDKIEMLANYFNILKSDLIEEKVTAETEKDNEILADIIVRMRVEEEFGLLVKSLYTLDSEKIKSVRQMLNAFTQ